MTTGQLSVSDPNHEASGSGFDPHDGQKCFATTEATGGLHRPMSSSGHATVHVVTMLILFLGVSGLSESSGSRKRPM